MPTVDPVSGVDRFAQNRRVLAADWSGADGTSVHQELAGSPEMQVQPLGMVADVLTLTIAATSTPGDRDYNAISEIQVTGHPVG
ncbi:hypothetical protein [Nakamurella sp.]|uniref:hypothetical protein n=1 Tax=Nakamurella sp. TaxID=1869182 RepID=UPI003B3AC2E4